MGVYSHKGGNLKKKKKKKKKKNRELLQITVENGWIARIAEKEMSAAIILPKFSKF